MSSKHGIRPGDIYEDCFYHPCVCVEINHESDEIWGVSLIDGSHPRSCSLSHCGVRKLTIENAWNIKMNGPNDLPEGEEIPGDKKWW